MLYCLYSGDTFQCSRLSRNQDWEELYCVMRIECIYSTLLYSAYSVPTQLDRIDFWMELGEKEGCVLLIPRKLCYFGEPIII